MKPELRRGIFERFRQADGGMERKAGGIGLGLAIAKEFVELHQGRIELSDSDLGGARFEVTIPFNRGADAAGAPPSEVRLDRFVYNPDRKAGNVVIEASRGAFRFVSGSQNPSNYTIKTPLATIGVRGAIFRTHAISGRRVV